MRISPIMAAEPSEPHSSQQELAPAARRRRPQPVRSAPLLAPPSIPSDFGACLSDVHHIYVGEAPAGREWQVAEGALRARQRKGTTILDLVCGDANVEQNREMLALD
ncbi:hypothetical protein E2562_028822 [Oryza meyeriana var. granulata]|uniref:Uncharacterized protein n=1 Tax=Oryza meyeriana var. granulata TaxID=110450 RepID=A0A6G1FDD7_9ORYZ|nr:hypothetical protein E2562_028822 [Oryza meyeriana var. granulata]